MEQRERPLVEPQAFLPALSIGDKELCPHFLLCVRIAKQNRLGQTAHHLLHRGRISQKIQRTPGKFPVTARICSTFWTSVSGRRTGISTHLPSEDFSTGCLLSSSVFQDCRLGNSQENPEFSPSISLSQMGHGKKGRFRTDFFGFTAYVAAAPPPPPAWIFPTTATGGTPFGVPHRFPCAPGRLWRNIHTGCRRRGVVILHHIKGHAVGGHIRLYVVVIPQSPVGAGPGHRRGGTPARRG